MKTYITQDKKPSQMFIDSLSYGGGSHYMVCGHCGRTHYCPNSEALKDDYREYDGEVEEDVYKNYLQNALDEQKENPDSVVIHYDVDVVMSKELNGMAFVLDCPCNGLYKYEVFIWAERNAIRDYLKVRIEQEHQWAEQELTLNKLAGISV